MFLLLIIWKKMCWLVNKNLEINFCILIQVFRLMQTDDKIKNLKVLW